MYIYIHKHIYISQFLQVIYIYISFIYHPSFSPLGDEGDFVLVRKENGIEGWTKVRNLSSAVLPLEAIECRDARRMVPEALKALAN